MKLWKDTNADSSIGTVLGILVTIIIGALVLFAIVGGLDYSGVDKNIKENVFGYSQANWDAGGSNSSRASWNGTTYYANATEDTLEQAETFFTIAPIIAIVIVAVVILSYVGKIGGGGEGGV